MEEEAREFVSGPMGVIPFSSLRRVCVPSLKTGFGLGHNNNGSPSRLPKCPALNQGGGGGGGGTRIWGMA